MIRIINVRNYCLLKVWQRRTLGDCW